MKFVLFLILVYPASSFAGTLSCPDFSGTFVEESSAEVLNVEQWGCSTLRATYRNRACASLSDQLIFDGVKYYSPGSQTDWQSHVIVNNAILGDLEWVEQGKVYRAKNKIYLDSNQNLIQEYSLPDISGNYVITSTRIFTNAMRDGAPEIPSCPVK